MKIILYSTLLFFLLLYSSIAAAGQVAITIDDPSTQSLAGISACERTEKNIHTLKKYDVQVALFVCGERINNRAGKELIQRWDDAGHLIGNHSYSHLYFNSPKITYQKYSKDIHKGEAVISNYEHYEKLYRFPYLKEGNTKKKRDQLRHFLRQHNYKTGHVSIDASDWYIDERMRKHLDQNPKANLTKYKEYYLNHIWERTQYYDSLAKKVLGREVKHTLLIHDNLLTALFLDDLIKMFKKRGWQIIDADNAYSDPIYSRQPNIIPAGESIIWALAKETGKYNDILRYPAEDGRYEKERMDKLGL